MAYERIKCPKCEKDFGQEIRFLEHLKNCHNVEDVLSFYVHLFNEDKQPKCACSPTCDVDIPWLGWKRGFVSKYARGHNARVDSVYLKPDKQQEMAAKRAETYASGAYAVWNKGLTKETSKKITDMSLKTGDTMRKGYFSGSFVDWRLSDSEKAKLAAEKISMTKKSMFATGELVPWNKGLTKETNLSLASAAEKIKARYDKSGAGRRIKPADLEARLAFHADGFHLLSSIEDYKRRRIDRLKFVCKQCGAEQLKSLAMLEESPICFSCAPKESKGQIEVYNFVASITPDAILSDRSLIAPREVDILVPSKKLAIEYNGLYWHSVSNIPDRNYHEIKRKSVEAAGHKFFMIFEDEWKNRRQIVEGMLRHRLGVPGEVLDARKLQIKELDNMTAAAFFEMSHLEGHVRCFSCFGLVDESGRVVAAMSLRKPFHASKAILSLEVARSACLPGITIRGWIGRLTSVSLKKAKSLGFQSIISYVDARVGDGKSYLTAGWRLESSPKGARFWWTDYGHRYNRFKYKADKIRNLSQEEVAKESGVVEIWGCGNYLMKINCD